MNINSSQCAEGDVKIPELAEDEGNKDRLWSYNEIFEGLSILFIYFDDVSFNYLFNKWT